MKVEVFYFDGCPSYEALLPRLRELMAEAGVDERIELKAVESVEAAERGRFLGSPTLRIDGQDVEPAARERTDFGLKCRLYASADGVRGTVPDTFVVTALTRARDAPVGVVRVGHAVPPRAAERDRRRLLRMPRQWLRGRARHRAGPGHKPAPP